MGYSEDEVDEYSAIWRHPASSIPGSNKARPDLGIVEHGWAYRQPELVLSFLFGAANRKNQASQAPGENTSTNRE